MPPSTILKFPAAVNLAESDIAALVDVYADLKERIKALTAQADQYAHELARRAEFKDDCKTSAPIFGQHFSLKVQKKETVTYDNQMLREKVWPVLQDQMIELFDWKFEPKTKKLNGYLEYGEHRELVQAARTVKEAKPYLTVESLESC